MKTKSWQCSVSSRSEGRWLKLLMFLADPPVCITGNSCMALWCWGMSSSWCDELCLLKKRVRGRDWDALIFSHAGFPWKCGWCAVGVHCQGFGLLVLPCSIKVHQHQFMYLILQCPDPLGNKQWDFPLQQREKFVSRDYWYLLWTIAMCACLALSPDACTLKKRNFWVFFYPQGIQHWPRQRMFCPRTTCCCIRSLKKLLIQARLQ